MSALNTITFTLQLRPVSINDAYYRAGQLKTASRKYRYELLTQLLEHKKAIFAFRTHALDCIMKHNNALRLEIVHLVPKDLYYTKQGQMSMRAGDVDNYSKLLQDFLLNPRYCSESESYSKDSFVLAEGIQPANIGIDDRFVQTIVASKIPYDGDRWQVQVKISVLPIQSAA